MSYLSRRKMERLKSISLPTLRKMCRENPSAYTPDKQAVFLGELYGRELRAVYSALVIKNPDINREYLSEMVQQEHMRKHSSSLLEAVTRPAFTVAA